MRACFDEGNRVVLEDLRSTNGTFVNGRPVTRHVLQHGDEVLVGKHSARVRSERGRAAAGCRAPIRDSATPSTWIPSSTRLRATLESARADTAKSVNARPPVDRLDTRRLVSLRVAGRAEQEEYSLGGTPRSLDGRHRVGPSARLVQAVCRGRHREVGNPTWPPPWAESRSSTRRPRRPASSPGRRQAVCSGLVLEFAWKERRSRGIGCLVNLLAQ